MALTSISHLNIKSINIPYPSSSSSSIRPTNPPSFVSQNDQRKWKTMLSTTLAAAVITFSSDKSAMAAELSKYEAEARCEFQYGFADLSRGNFMSAVDMRQSDFKANFTEGRDNHQVNDTAVLPFYTSFLDTQINQQQTPTLEDFNNKNQEELKVMAEMVDFVKWVMEDSLQELANFLTEYFASRGHYSLSRLYEHSFRDGI